MMIGMVADMPDILEDVRAWQPVSYGDHFVSSGLSIGPLAIEAYDACEARYREPFDATLQQFNERVSTGCAELAAVVASGDAGHISFQANALSMELQGMIDLLSAIIHGAAEVIEGGESEGLSQEEIDALF